MPGDGIAPRHKKALLDIFAGCGGIEKVVLFGSRAMGSYTTQSDIDIALVGDDITLTDQARILDAIEQTNIPQRVDIVLYRTITSDKLLQHIEEFGVEWDFGGAL
ncbi:nucleotidyltransferase domain-containing protein [Maridesulfovibrio sp.]|uniref:nucleotidyltransferase domain-containing protein n=1 Tax=Maridesulfovibrio sp. TaxID=2795000 RepID=UPI0029CA9689|nr:nucleotidyltransferase domain-containing protein [Maridesulfovibrio sp.]